MTMQETPPKTSSASRTAIIAAVVGGIAGVIVGPLVTILSSRIVDQAFPSVQRITVVGQSSALSVSSDSQDFVYRLKFDHHEDAHWSGLQRVRSLWVFSLDVANLSQKEQPWVQVSLRCSTPDDESCIGSNRRNDLYLNPDDTKSIEGTDGTTKRSIAYIKKLEARTAKTIVICVAGSNTPDLKDIELHVSSPDGEYTSVSNATWDSYGWHN